MRELNRKDLKIWRSKRSKERFKLRRRAFQRHVVIMKTNHTQRLNQDCIIQFNQVEWRRHQSMRLTKKTWKQQRNIQPKGAEIMKRPAEQHMAQALVLINLDWVLKLTQWKEQPKTSIKICNQQTRNTMSQIKRRSLSHLISTGTSATQNPQSKKSTSTAWTTERL